MCSDILLEFKSLFYIDLHSKYFHFHFSFIHYKQSSYVHLLGNLLKLFINIIYVNSYVCRCNIDNIKFSNVTKMTSPSIKNIKLNLRINNDNTKNFFHNQHNHA